MPSQYCRTERANTEIYFVDSGIELNMSFTNAGLPKEAVDALAEQAMALVRATQAAQQQLKLAKD